MADLYVPVYSPGVARVVGVVELAQAPLRMEAAQERWSQLAWAIAGGSGIVLCLIVVVAAFNILATLTMVVKEKRRDIAILKSMGAASGAIARVFVLKGAVIGVVGTLLGNVLGHDAMHRYFAAGDAQRRLAPVLRLEHWDLVGPSASVRARLGLA